MTAALVNILLKNETNFFFFFKVYTVLTLARDLFGFPVFSNIILNISFLQMTSALCMTLLVMHLGILLWKY